MVPPMPGQVSVLLPSNLPGQDLLQAPTVCFWNPEDTPQIFCQLQRGRSIEGSLVLGSWFLGSELCSLVIGTARVSMAMIAMSRRANWRFPSSGCSMVFQNCPELFVCVSNLLFLVCVVGCLFSCRCSLLVVVGRLRSSSVSASWWWCLWLWSRL